MPRPDYVQDKISIQSHQGLTTGKTYAILYSINNKERSMRSILLIVSILALNACSITDQRGRDSMSQWLYQGSTSTSIGDVNRVNDWGSRLPNMPGDYERFCKTTPWNCRQHGVVNLPHLLHFRNIILAQDIVGKCSFVHKILWADKTVYSV